VLKTIPHSFTPDLLWLMMAMGHGEELLISDGNFPARTTGNTSIPKIYLPVQDIATLLSDIFRFFPLDETTTTPLIVMETAKESGVYEQYQRIADAEGIGKTIGTLERYDFYRRAGSVAGIVITASTVRGGNIILKKGVVF